MKARLPRTVVVTGASGGLGRALVERLTADGHRVIATDVTGDCERLDVTDPDACRAVADRYRPDVWINNAAVLHPGDCATQPDEEIRQVLDVTLRGSINGSRAAVASMRAHSGGHLITIASLAAWVPVPGETAYAAAKAGVLSFSLGLRAELALQGVRDIEVSVVCPDGMLTPMISEHIDDPAVAMSFSGVRTVEPDEVAEVVVRLLRRPRAVVSVPHWRGGLVRFLGMVPDRALALAGPMQALGDRNRRRARAARARDGL